AAFGDLFNDGHIDVVLNNLDSAPVLLRNVVENGNHWLTLKLVGGPKSPRDATGAKIFLSAGGVRQRMDIISGGSYQSSSDPRVHFGLGQSETIDSIEIDWPSGLKEMVDMTALNRDGPNRITSIQEGQGVALSRNLSPSATK